MKKKKTNTSIRLISTAKAKHTKLRIVSILMCTAHQQIIKNEKFIHTSMQSCGYIHTVYNVHTTRDTACFHSHTYKCKVGTILLLLARLFTYIHITTHTYTARSEHFRQYSPVVRTEQTESVDRVVGVAHIKPALIDSTISVFQILQ